MKKLLLSIAAPLCVMSCCNVPVEGGDIGEGAQEILDSLSVESVFATLALDQVAVAGAQPTADGIAQALVDKINAERAGCATAAIDALNVAQVSVSFSNCKLGEGEQSVSINGALSSVVAVDAQVVSFSSSATGLQVNGVSTNDTTNITIDVANNALSFSREVSFSLGPDPIALSAAGSFLLDGQRATINALYNVTANGATRAHQWTDVVLQEGTRLPVSGQVVVAEAVGGELRAVISNDDIFTLDTTQSGVEQSFDVQFRDAEPALFQVCSPVETSAIEDRRERRSTTATLALGCFMK